MAAQKVCTNGETKRLCIPEVWDHYCGTVYDGNGDDDDDDVLMMMMMRRRRMDVNTGRINDDKDVDEGDAAALLFSPLKICS